MVAPSIIHQCMNIVMNKERFAHWLHKNNPSKGVENYFINSILYEDILETSGDSVGGNYNYGHDANSKPELTEEEDFK